MYDCHTSPRKRRNALGRAAEAALEAAAEVRREVWVEGVMAFVLRQVSTA